MNRRLAVNGLYRGHAELLNGIIWLVPKGAGRFRLCAPFPEVGCEPFDIEPEELARDWERHTKEVR
jgi:hypothetical protein